MMGSSVVTAVNMFLKCSVILLACSFSDPAYGKGGITARLRWPAARDMGQTRGLRFSHVLIDRHLIHHHTKAFSKTKPLNAYIRQLTTCPSCF